MLDLVSMQDAVEATKGSWEEGLDALATQLINEYGYQDAAWRNMPPNNHGLIDARKLKNYFRETLDSHQKELRERIAEMKVNASNFPFTVEEAPNHAYNKALTDIEALLDSDTSNY